jgi:hypothetical protein
MNRIVKYVKYTKGQRKNQLRGCVVATVSGVGWSLCNKKDNFSKVRALEIATNRANIGSKVSVPNCISVELVRIGERRKKATNFLSVPA